MNKIIYVLISGCILVTKNLIAQPVLTASQINPVVGDQIKIDGGNYVSPGSSGASQTWDLSTMKTGSPYSNTYVTPASTPYASDFPNANVAMGESDTYLYYKTSSASWQNVGMYAGNGVTMYYSNPEDMLRFPFTFNDTYTDTWATTFASGGYTFYRKGTTTITADGYGTLITPAGTFSNVLRIHSYQDYQDSASYMGIPYTVDYQNDEYQWYLNGTHYFIAFVYTLTSQGVTEAQEGYYMTNVLGVQENNILVSYTLSPNPVSDNLNININLKEKQPVIIKIFNSMGDEINRPVSAGVMRGSNNYSLNVQNLPVGIYCSEIFLDGKPASTRRFVVTR